MADNALAQIQCVMFDLDGTLIDSAPDIANSLNSSLRQMNCPTRELAQIRNWMGNGVARLIKRALTGKVNGEPPTPLFEQTQQLFFESYGQNINIESTLYQGALEGLKALHENGFILACVTNKPRRFTVPLLRDFGIQPLFEYLVCGDDLTVKKPDPRMLQGVLRPAGLGPGQAVMVGDSANDVKAARAANMKSFCVRYGYHQGQGVDALGADYIIDSIVEASHYLIHAE